MTKLTKPQEAALAMLPIEAFFHPAGEYVTMNRASGEQVNGVRISTLDALVKKGAAISRVKPRVGAGVTRVYVRASQKGIR